MRDWEDEDQVRELCGEGTGVGTVWVDFGRDVVEFVDGGKVVEGEGENDSGDEVEMSEEDVVIALTEFEECVEEVERKVCKAFPH